MANIQQLVDQLNANSPGANWTLFGNGTPVEETALVNVPADAASGTPATTVNRGTGRYVVVIQDGDGHQRKLPLKADPIKGGLEVPQTGVNDTVPDTTPNAKGQVDPAARKPNPNLYSGNLKDLSWTAADPIVDVTKSSPQASQDLINDKSKADAEQSRASADYATAQADAVRAKQALDNDPQNRALQDASAQATQALNAAQARNQDAAAAASAADTALKQQAAPGQIALTDAQRQVQEANAAKTAATTPSEIGLNQAQTAAQLAAAAKAAEPTVLTADTVAPLIMTMNPATGKIESQPNGNRITASEATSQLAQQLGLKVAQGSMSEKDAQDLITGAINTMNAQTQRISAEAAKQNADTAQQQNQITAAGDILANVRGNAQTGAGLLQQRAQTAQGMLGQVLGLAQGGTASGGMGGGMMEAPAPGFGAQLASGIGQWTAGLMGGQATMDSAARLLQMADPRSSLADPASQQAVSTLAQLMDKYHQATGAPHPAVAATQAMAQSQQTGGMAAPATAPNPAYASTGAGAVTAGYGATGNPWGNAPNGFPAPTTVQSPYSSSGLGPVGAGFAAPSTASPTIVIHMPGAA
jgi:hypothetical protein